jgi:cell division septation protein DedD
MADEAFHEIHLNGKQLVFMFMATTVVAVVIFLSGVMVGRGVPPRRAAGDVTATATGAAVDPTVPVTDASERTVPTRTTGTVDVPVTTQETLTYAERLEAPTPPRETMKEIADPPASAAAPATAKAPASARGESPGNATSQRQLVTPASGPQLADKTAAEPEPRLTAPGEPASAGWAVQVMAVPAGQRADAEALARRLAAKGYPSYVVPRGNRFAVRVGKYPNQREAEAVSARLKKEEQFDPWVTR